MPNKLVTALAVATEENRTTGDISDKQYLLEEYEGYLKKQGLMPSTIEGYVRKIKSLINAGVNISNENSVKEYLASRGDTLDKGTKRNIVHAVQNLFLMLYDLEWKNKPKYKREKKTPLKPDEELLLKIVDRIPGKYRPFCKMTMETGSRPIELWNLKWNDVDLVNQNVSITPAKNGNGRELPITDDMVKMLNIMHRESEYVFRKGKLEHFREGFRRHLIRLAREFGEEKIKNCSLKTWRTWYANDASERLDIWDLKYRMGHVKIETTNQYVQRGKTRNKKYTPLVTKNSEEDKTAIAERYEFITKTAEGWNLWRKPI